MGAFGIFEQANELVQKPKKAPAGRQSKIMLIGGLQKFSLLDYPGHLSAIIFTQGCNFRCQYCYNPMLVWPVTVGKFKNSSSSKRDGGQKDHPANISEDDLFAFLKKRVGKLDAAVITGGEPTLHDDLPEFIAKIKKLKFKVKLDTNGTNPDAIKKLIDNNLLDYIAMDIKAPAGKYDLITGVQPDLDKIKKSVKIIKESKLPHEFRTTIVPELIDFEDIAKIGGMIRGAEKWFLQQFKSDVDLVNASFKGAAAYSEEEMRRMKEIGEKYAKECFVR